MALVLLPVKDPAWAKQRLSLVMSQRERTQLAWAMLRDVAAALNGARKPGGVVMVTSSRPVIDFARQHHWEVLKEAGQESESASVDWASRELQKRGVKAVLRLPGDVPLVDASDIDKLLDQQRQDRCALAVPSRQGTGTNALLRRPPAAFPSRFGPDSLRLHVNEARKCGIRCVLVRNRHISLDLDEPDDILNLLAGQGAPHTRDYLSSIDVMGRLQNAPA